MRSGAAGRAWRDEWEKDSDGHLAGSGSRPRTAHLGTGSNRSDSANLRLTGCPGSQLIGTGSAASRSVVHTTRQSRKVRKSRRPWH